MMSNQVQELVPNSKYMMPNQRRDPASQDKEIGKLHEHLMKKVVIPILKKDHKNTNPISDKKIIEFIKYFTKLGEFAEQQNPDLIQRAKADLKVYQEGIEKIKQNQMMTIHSKKESMEISEILIDYTENIIPMMAKKMSLLESAIRQVDSEDLLRSLYGSLLSFFCLYTLIESKEFQTVKTFTNIAHQGHEFAKKLDGFIDTLDILTNPDEDDIIRNIK